MSQNFPEEAPKLLADKVATVGKTPAISVGDRQSVIELIRLAAAREAADRARAEKEAADRASREVRDREARERKAGLERALSPGHPTAFPMFHNLRISGSPSPNAFTPPLYYETSSPSPRAGKKGSGGRRRK